MSYSCSRLAVILLTALLGGSMTPGLHAQSAAANTPAIKPCKDEAAYHKLDFWLGHWEVFDLHGGSKDGTDSVEKILKGCAIVEIWHDIEGYEGRSLFYYQRATKQWKQVWVTDAGPMKEKRLIEELQDGGVRFQGEIPHQDGTSHLDRTTLTPLPRHRVHQVIEISSDQGKTWAVTFDAEYRRQGKATRKR